MSEIRLATEVLSKKIYAGTPNAKRDGFRGKRHDVTSDVLKCVSEHIGIGYKVTVMQGGVPLYDIAVTTPAGTDT